jgi:hypothetical protein
VSAEAGPEVKEVFCRSCGRTRLIPKADAQGHPYGWFYLTVHVPPWFNHGTARPYRAVGLFCSAACLAAGLPSIEADEELLKGAYEHE